MLGPKTNIPVLQAQFEVHQWNDLSRKDEADNFPGGTHF